MKVSRILGLVLGVALIVSAYIPAARATEWDKTTKITFTRSIQIPGTVLPSGTYVFKLLDSPSNRHVVQIFNADQTQLITTVLAIPNYQLEPSEKTVLTYAERPSGQPEALEAWFYPGDNFGQQFVYPKSESEQPSRVNHVRLTTAGDMANSAQPTAPSSNPTTQSDQAAPVPQDAREPSNSRAQTETNETKELPKTASSLPLIGLVGVLLVGTALILRRIARA
ncbi:MAG: hypothetical protein WBC04_19530 [Candidatus Acidiferrales bacterium]